MNWIITRYFSVAVILLSALVSNAAASEPLAARETLPNGLVLMHSQKSTLPIVRIVIGIGAGQLADPPGKAGLASLTASLLKEGTTHRTSKQISEEIEFVAGSLSASGGGEYATISLSALKKDLETGFEIMSDILLNPTFSDEEIARKKAQVKGAIRRRMEDPGDVASKAFMKALYPNHPLGFPAEGTPETLDAITRDDIVSFHRAWYSPDNAWMAVVGDVTRQEAGALIDKYLSGWTARGAKLAFPPVPKLAKTSVIAIDKDITQANIILGHDGPTRSDPDYYSALVMNYILGGGGFSSRMMDSIRDNMGLAYDVGSHFAPGRHNGLFTVDMQTKNASAKTAIDEALRQIERIRIEPVTDIELAGAKAYITGSFPLRLDTTAKIANLLSSVEYFGLGMNYVDDYRKAVEAVTKDDVLRAAKKFLHPDRYVLVVVAKQAETKTGK